MTNNQQKFIKRHLMVTERGRKIVMPLLAASVMSLVLLSATLGVELLFIAFGQFINIVVLNAVYELTKNAKNT